VFSLTIISEGYWNIFGMFKSIVVEHDCSSTLSMSVCSVLYDIVLPVVLEVLQCMYLPLQVQDNVGEMRLWRERYILVSPHRCAGIVSDTQGWQCSDPNADFRLWDWKLVLFIVNDWVGQVNGFILRLCDFIYKLTWYFYFAEHFFWVIRFW